MNTLWPWVSDSWSRLLTSKINQPHRLISLPPTSPTLTGSVSDSVSDVSVDTTAPFLSANRLKICHQSLFTSAPNFPHVWAFQNKSLCRGRVTPWPLSWSSCWNSELCSWSLNKGISLHPPSAATDEHLRKGLGRAAWPPRPRPSQAPPSPPGWSDPTAGRFLLNTAGPQPPHNR